MRTVRLTITPQRAAPKRGSERPANRRFAPDSARESRISAELCETGKFFEACKSPGCCATQPAGTSCRHGVFPGYLANGRLQGPSDFPLPSSRATRGLHDRRRSPLSSSCSDALLPRQAAPSRATRPSERWAAALASQRVSAARSTSSAWRRPCFSTSASVRARCVPALLASAQLCSASLRTSASSVRSPWCSHRTYSVHLVRERGDRNCRISQHLQAELAGRMVSGSSAIRPKSATTSSGVGVSFSLGKSASSTATNSTAATTCARFTEASSPPGHGVPR
jgi:hypothetical protein